MKDGHCAATLLWPPQRVNRGICARATPKWWRCAVLMVDQVAKPLIGRQIDGVVGSYPSGTVTAVSALAAAAVLVTPRVFRAATAVVAAALVVGICAAVVVLRWHYPTDALGGACVGIGAVLFLDGLAHLLWVVGVRAKSLRGPHHREQRSAGWT